MRSILTFIVLCLFPFAAEAGRWLDYLRKFDLNDYALGVAVTNSQSPYAGADDVTVTYPFLTSFEHSALNNSILVLRDGELALRRINNSGWEFALGGRVQARSFGNHDSDLLRGVAEPKWTLELGPTIGLRRWPVQLHLAAFAEPTKRHDGLSARFAVSYPVQLSRGYIVPEVEVNYQDSKYNDYYFGVSPEEETPIRPAYSPGDASNFELKVVWAFELSKSWLLSGKLSYEMLDDSIQASPLVDREHLWSANLGLAYNSDVFNASNFYVDPGSRSFDFRVGAFNASVDTKIGRETENGVPGDEIDLESLLGESDNETVVQLDAIWRVGRFHRLEAGYFELARSGRIVLPEGINFGGQTYAEGDEMRSQSHFKSLRIGYAYSFMRGAQKELGVMAGIHFSSFDSIISSLQSDDIEKTRLDAPLPVIGAHGSVNLGDNTVVAARLQIFRTDFDGYEGSLNYFTLDAQRLVTEQFHVGLGYNYYRMKLHASGTDLNGYVDIEHHGPVLFAGYNF